MISFSDPLPTSFVSYLNVIHRAYTAESNADAFCICMPDLKDEIGMIAHNAFDELAVYNKSTASFLHSVYMRLRNRGISLEKMRLCKTGIDSAKAVFDYLAYYRPEISRRLLENQWVINEMQHALDSNQFEVYLQPKYDINRGYPSGSEALIRWNHPTR